MIMLNFVNTPLIPVPKDATQEERKRIFLEWCDLHQKNNPTKILPRGVKKKWWQFWLFEHPFTKFDEEKK